MAKQTYQKGNYIMVGNRQQARKLAHKINDSVPMVIIGNPKEVSQKVAFAFSGPGVKSVPAPRRKAKSITPKHRRIR